MTTPDSRLRGLEDAVGLIKDGDTVAIGGDQANAPMALVREMARQRKRGLHLIGNRGIALDLLVASGCAATVATPPPQACSDSPVLDRAIAAGAITMIERSRALILARLRAAACGVPFMVAGPDIGTSCTDPAVMTVTDPFTGLSCQAIQANRPDVAIIHAQTADALGIVQCASTPRHDEPADAVMARSARIAIVSVEHIVSSEAIALCPLDTLLRPPAVACVVEAPYGAHPGRCDGRYDADCETLDDFRIASRDPAALEAWLRHWVQEPGDHWAYLDRIGSRRLLRVSQNRNRRV